MPLKNFEILDLSANYIEDESLSRFALTQFPLLKSLDLSYNHITSRGIISFPPTDNIKSLWLKNIPLNEEGIKHIILFRNLENLNIYNRGVMPNLLLQFPSHPNIKQIAVTPGVLEEVGRLHLIDNTGMIDSSEVLINMVFRPRQLVGEENKDEDVLFNLGIVVI